MAAQQQAAIRDLFIFFLLLSGQTMGAPPPIAPALIYFKNQNAED